MRATSVRRAVSVFILGAAVVFHCAAGFVRRAAAGVFFRRAPECSFIELLSDFRRAAVGLFFRRAAAGVFVRRAEGVFVL